MGESSPSVSQIITEGAPPEWLPFVIIASAMTIAMFVLDTWVLIKHKKFFTKFPIQFLCTVGILQVFPFFCLMQTVGMIVPNSHDMTMFLTEGYESLTFLFFLRLLVTYMGGKKATKAALQGSTMHLNVPPVCCLVCIPHAKFTRKFFIFCEFLVALYAFFCLAVGFIELVMVLDGSKGYPSDMITGQFAAIYHILLVVLLFGAIYGLSGIYHSAEDLLKHRGIVRKFLVYKIFTLLAKFQDLIFGTLVHHDVIDEKSFTYNSIWSTALRVRIWVAFIICVEAMIAFPLAIRFYSTDDYVHIVRIGEKNKGIPGDTKDDKAIPLPAVSSTNNDAQDVLKNDSVV